LGGFGGGGIVVIRLLEEEDDDDPNPSEVNDIVKKMTSMAIKTCRKNPMHGIEHDRKATRAARPPPAPPFSCSGFFNFWYSSILSLVQAFVLLLLKGDSHTILLVCISSIFHPLDM
jgi:hypothetical protein